MRLLLTTILFLFLTLSATSPVDIITHKNDIYTSTYSTKYKLPLNVSYKLYKGGGDCSRENFSFTSTKFTATRKDYAKSGYDIGHLCNAEDFAFDCVKDKKTFSFYNAVPQTPELNRGIWKTHETLIRKKSQTDSLLIITGVIIKNPRRTIGNGVQVPKYCWKVVKSLKTKKVIFACLYTNTNKPVAKRVSVASLERLIGYKLHL